MRLTADESKVSAWVERRMGGRVVRFERQGRWRPMYFVDVERGDETLALMVRHARADAPLVFPLKHEMTFQNMLHEHGIPVPEVFGWHEDPDCFLMERLAGVSHLEGLDERARKKILREYVRVIVDIHQLPTEPFKRAGITSARHPGEAHLVGQRHFERFYRDNKRRPNAFIEFGLGWLKRHPIAPPARETLVTWDSAQFHRHDGELVGLVDLELGHVGDPMMDLGCLRLRDTILGFGDLEDLYRCYEELSGVSIDRDAIRFHHSFFTLTNALSFDAVLADPLPQSNYMIYLQWINETNRHALEAIADDLCADLPEIEMPQPEDTPAAAVCDQLVHLFGGMGARVDDSILRYELRNGFRLARHLARWEEIGRRVTEMNLDDMAELLGRRPSNWRDAEAALERFVLEDDGRHDHELVQLFNRRLQRAQALNGPPGSAMATHLKSQPLKR